MKTTYLIIGGGIAGLSAAIELAKKGEKPLLIESGSYPSHKVCGEFLSPESLPILFEWGVSIPSLFHKGTIKAKKNTLTLDFKNPAGAISHTDLTPQLVKLALKEGVTLYTEKKVSEFIPKTEKTPFHSISLSSHEKIEASHVIFATGKIPSYSSPPVFSYTGFKRHFKTSLSFPYLQMFSLSNAYLGIVPIEKNVYNIACIAKISEVEKFENPLFYIEEKIASSPDISSFYSKGDPLFDTWMVASVPSFGMRKTPAWKDTYFIGDAAISIPPASGDGLSMALFGGRLAAEYALKKEPFLFKKAFQKKCFLPLFFAKRLHSFMMNPSVLSPLLTLGKNYPSLSQAAFQLTRI